MTTDIYYKNLVSLLKEKDNYNKEKILNKIYNSKTLTEKCILIRNYLSPQSTDMEKIIKTELKINNAIDNTSGDGMKNNIKYEIKYSGHAKKSKLNFVQIRPDHNVDEYILICYNMYDKSSNLGKGYCFKIPHEKINELIIKYGGYAHGTKKCLEKITETNLKGRNCEYALRCNPNAKNGSKDNNLWNELCKYEVTYESKNF